MDFFKRQELSGLPPKDEREKVALDADGLVSAFCSTWNNLAVSSSRLEPIESLKITTARKTLCENHRKAANRLGLNVLSQWEIYLSEEERNIDRLFDREIMLSRFDNWMATRLINLSRSTVT